MRIFNVLGLSALVTLISIESCNTQAPIESTINVSSIDFWKNYSILSAEYGT